MPTSILSKKNLHRFAVNAFCSINWWNKAIKWISWLLLQFNWIITILIKVKYQWIICRHQYCRRKTYIDLFLMLFVLSIHEITWRAKISRLLKLPPSLIWWFRNLREFKCSEGQTEMVTRSGILWDPRVLGFLSGPKAGYYHFVPSVCAV